MDEYIKRADTLAYLDEGSYWEMEDFEEACALVKRVPAADVVEVVRCKDCMYAERLREEERSIYKKDVVVCSRCMTLDNKRPGNWYCPEGAKMDGGGDGND